MMYTQFLRLYPILLVLCPALSTFYQTVEIPLYFAPLRRVTEKASNGDVYIGGKNIVLHLNKNFTIQRNKTIGPEMNSKMCCPNSPVCDSKRMTDNHVEVLQFIPIRKMVLMCGSLQQGLCFFLNTHRISEAEKFYKEKTQNFVGSDKGTVFVPYKTEDQTEYYFIGRSWDGRKPDCTFPEFSFMGIHNRSYDPKEQWEFQNTTRFSSIGICEEKRRITSTHFLYGFSTDDFVFSIYTQARNTSIGMQIETKISRICKNDKYMRSFNEVILECNAHNIATAAYYKKSQGDPSLYVAFGISIASTEASRNDSAVVCQYTQSDIDNMFSNLITFCFNNGDALSPPDWSTCGESRKCDASVKVDLTNYCRDTNAHRANQGIQRLTKPFYHPSYLIYEEDQTILTSVFMQNVDHSNGILWLGTIDGFILKVNMDQPIKSRKAYVRFDLSHNRSQAIQPHHLELENDKDHIILLYGNKASKFPFFSCQVYSTCDACVNSGDPLGCGWCKDSCLMAKECPTLWHNTSCPPPFIDRIYPPRGPLKGGTLISIDGDYFLENSNIRPQVEIGDNVCNVVNVTNTRIVCNTSEAKLVGDFLVHVTTITQSSVKRSESRMLSYSYVRSYVQKTIPLSGPRHGNTLLTLYGDNLDSGLKTNIYISNIPCPLQRKNKTYLECRTNECQEGISHIVNCVGCHPIKITIDDESAISNGIFCYNEDPEINKVSRNTTILSGGLSILVDGKNFNNANSHTLRLRIAGTNETVDSNCLIRNSSQLLCRTPYMSDKLSGHDTKLEMMVLLEDDDIYWQKWKTSSTPFYLAVYQDPVFKRNVSLDKNLFYIYGENLDGLHPDDFLITMGDKVYPALDLAPNYLTLKSTSPLPIKISVGNQEKVIEASFHCKGIQIALFRCSCTV